jgi:hypothetical protein
MCVHKLNSIAVCDKYNKCELLPSECSQLMDKHLRSARDTVLKNCQEGICPICGLRISEGEAVLDHQHKKRVKGSGLIRGVLCRTCNSYLGKVENAASRFRVVKENLPQVLRNMALFLDKPHYNLIHPTEKDPIKKLTKVSYNKLKKSCAGSNKKFPEYPRSGKLTIELSGLYDKAGILPEFYKS